MKILIIEDEAQLRRSIKEYFYRERWVVESARDYAQAFSKILLYEYDCVLLDIGLPDGNGLTLIKTLKEKNSKAGLIIISAKDSLDDKIEGLEYGADDYLTKPFHLAELNARIKALVRRKNFEGNGLIHVNDLVLNTDNKTVHVDETEVTLTLKEYELLLFFIANQNKVITKESIAERLWGDGIDSANSFFFVYTHIKNLRKKILAAGGQDSVKTIYAMGYKFVS